MEPRGASNAEARSSVSVWCYVEGPVRVLLVKRPPSRAAGWQPVTGRVEPGESLEDACGREVREETGLPPPDELFPLERETTFLGYDGATYHQHAFAARYAHARAPIVSDEHEEARWVTPQEARALLKWDEDQALLDALLARLDVVAHNDGE